MAFGNAFAEVALTLLVAALVGALGTWLRQPLIVSFIAVGLLVGPAGMSLVTQPEQIELLAGIGISLLLFVVGLKLDFHTIRTLGPVALATGIAQVGFTAVIGVLIAASLGMDGLTAIYVAVAVTFSSTIIVVKLLSDKREIDALHGRIAVGVLIVQDLAVILVMIAVTAFGGERAADQSLAAHATQILVKGLGFLAVVSVLAVRVLPAATIHLARSPELLVLSGIAWAVVLAATGEALGLRQEVGAFVAGASLASTPYREAIGSRLVTVRDFLLLFFFIDLGARLDLSLLGATFGAALILSAFVLIGKPLLVMIILGLMGYRKRTNFLSGLAVAQISEFSLILGALGVSVGHLGPDAMGLVTTVGLITIGLSTYMIIHAARLYEWLAPWLGVFERRTPYREAAADTGAPPRADVVILGLGRYGGGIVRHLLLRNRRVVGVDFDPEALARWRAEGIPVIYGDASDPELFERLPLEGANWVVSTAPDIDTSRVLLHHLRERGFRGKVAVACRTADEGDVLRLEGADVLLRPYADAAEQAADAITTAMDRLGALATVAPGLREVRLGSTSKWAGHLIADVPLREEFGATVLAVSRGGRSFFNPGPAFQLFPGDRLILSGEPHALDRAIDYLTRIDPPSQEEAPEDFAVEEVRVSALAGWAGRTLAALQLPARFGVTVLAVATDHEQLSAPDPHRPLQEHDRLVLAGTPGNLQRVRDAAEGAPKGAPSGSQPYGS
ncbi:MAG: cation:proton antiporter [Acidobacteria bacterium]|nr:cation:proton antiporter [Acidobacteriota bacterium]